jgi:membrane protein implicated in regulation of membrane protease activity
MSGYLTYSLAVAAILWGVTGFLFGWTDTQTAMQAIWSGLAAFGLRRAVAKNGTGA